MEILRLRAGLKHIGTAYMEKRTDVSEMAHEILEGEAPTKITPEGRYIYWHHKGVAMEYDTLTTLVSYETESGEWQTLLCDYADDSEGSPLDYVSCPKCKSRMFFERVTITGAQLKRSVLLLGDCKVEISRVEIEDYTPDQKATNDKNMCCANCGFWEPRLFTEKKPECHKCSDTGVVVDHAADGGRDVTVSCDCSEGDKKSEEWSEAANNE